MDCPLGATALGRGSGESQRLSEVGAHAWADRGATLAAVGGQGEVSLPGGMPPGLVGSGRPHEASANGGEI